ncbi:MAG: potassium-transporting ATPase subunit KdpC [Ignavibacteriales bacterium]|nr:potassium-transporting ATPase subunit KdpC [Ignavibacteriales bacterium]
MKPQIVISLKIFLMLTIITGLIYPLFITFAAQIIFPQEASGSVIKKDGKLIGSELIGQKFVSDKYFSSRPSEIDFSPMPSGASNFGMTSTKLKSLFDERKKEFAEKNYINDADLTPHEMLFASASGVDPHITPQAAFLQVGRITKARNFDEHRRRLIILLIASLTEKPQFGFLCKPTINVLLLNIELDKIE